MISSELAAMLVHDEHHWWYRGRRRVLRTTLDRLDLPPAARLLDAGCGSGRTLDELQHYGVVAGIDLSAQAAACARARGHANVDVGRVETLHFPDDTFDVVTCLDVIEHTPDDRATLRELRRVTRPNGLLVITVPAHPALWSTHDEVNLHYRRYTRSTLHAVAARAGLSMVSDTYFNSVLLAPAAAVRWGRRLHPGPAGRSDLTLTPRLLDGALEWPMIAEARLIASGGRVPFGLSLLAVLRAPAQRTAVRPIARVTPRSGARLRPRHEEQLGRSDRPADVQGDPHDPGGASAVARDPGVGPEDAVGLQRRGQLADRDRPAHVA